MHESSAQGLRSSPPGRSDALGRAALGAGGGRRAGRPRGTGGRGRQARGEAKAVAPAAEQALKAAIKAAKAGGAAKAAGSLEAVRLRAKEVAAVRLRKALDSARAEGADPALLAEAEAALGLRLSLSSLSFLGCSVDDLQRLLRVAAPVCLTSLSRSLLRATDVAEHPQLPSRSVARDSV